MPRLYKCVLPQSAASNDTGYAPNENIDFEINCEGQTIKQRSIRLCGELVCTNLGANTTIDALTGIHSAFASVVTESNGRVVESLQSYPRIMKMKMEARQDDATTIANSSNLTSLKLARDEQTTSFLKGIKGRSGILPFVCPIDFCLNNTNADIPFDNVGRVRISLRTASLTEFFTNRTMAGDLTTYSLKNLELCYQVEEGSKKNNKLAATTYAMVKHIVDSNNVSISTRVPAVCQSMACSFIKQSDENSDGVNHLLCAKLPNVSRVNFTLNDSMSIVKYSIESEEELLLNYLRAMNSVSYNNIRKVFLDEGRNYGLGLDFFGDLDLRQVPMGIDIVSTADNTNKYSMYCYFRSVIGL